jgi:hypothetical protein
MKPVLFLDVDGVLNNKDSVGYYALNPKLLGRLREIQRRTNCDIVLSSTWRRSPSHKDVLEAAFEDKGIRKWIDETPVLPDIRGKEIQAWIDANPELDCYAILDDDSDMLPSQLQNFFQTDPDYGLSKTIAYRVTYHLLEGYYGHRVQFHLRGL